MTKPDVPLRLEFSIEVPGTPEQVWDAIATAEGISSWFLRTELEEREGGAIVTYMGEDNPAPGTVSRWDPPHVFAYSEPDWATYTGHDAGSVTPLVSEFIVEAKSGGTCVIRVVSSAFGSGADWEREFFAEAEKGWRPFFDRLRLYLELFPGQHATLLTAERTFQAPPSTVWAAMLGALGVSKSDQPFEFRGHQGRVDGLGEGYAFIRLAQPAPGFLTFGGFGDDESTVAQVQAQLFSSDAPEVVEREKPGWEQWLASLDVAATAPAS